MSDNSLDSSYSVYKRLLGYTKKARLAFGIGIVGNLIYAAMEGLFIYLLKPLTDETLFKADIEHLKMVPVFILGILLVRSIAAVVSTYCMAWVGQGIVQRLREQLVEVYINLPTPFFDRYSSGDLISKVTFNTQQVANASSDAITQLVRQGGIFIAIIGGMFYVNWHLTAIYFVCIPIIAFLVAITSKRFKGVSNKIQDAMGSVTRSTQEIVDGYKVVKTFNGEKFEQERFNKTANKNRQQNLKLILTKAVSVPVIQLIAGIAMGVVIYFAAIEMENGRLTSGGFVYMAAAMMAILKPLKTLSNLNVVLQQGIAGAQDIFNVLDQEKEIDKGHLELKEVPEKISFEEVCFSYNEGSQIIKGLSFDLEKGQTVALVGRSGSGKSTITNLLLRFYQPCAGAIKINDSNINNFLLSSLRQNIAYVSQQVVLFSDTIKANIAYAEKEVDEQRLLNAAKKAHALEFIEKLDDGFDYHIGEKGNRLSGGQRQRIAIARAIYKDSPIIILDEATSALDTESERHIQAALEALTKERTTLVIAHRLSTIENADNIIVMEDGKIVEQGTHNELLQKNGAYNALHAKEFSQQDPD